MMKLHQINWLLLTTSHLIIGCTDSSSTDQYKAVSLDDATLSQRTIEQTIATNPKPNPVQPELRTESPLEELSGSGKNQPTQSDRKTNNFTNNPEQTLAPKLLVTEREFPTTSPDNVLRIAFDDIDLEKIFDIKETPKDLATHFPKWLKSLDGQRVRIRGYMVPTFQAEDLVGFTLARDTSACCFGPNPKVSYLIEVWMKNGKTSEYIHYRPFDVVGILHVGTEVTPGRLYTIEDAIVIPK